MAHLKMVKSYLSLSLSHLSDDRREYFLHSQQHVHDLGRVARVDDPLPLPDEIPNLLRRQVSQGAWLVLAKHFVFFLHGFLVVVADVDSPVGGNDVA